MCYIFVTRCYILPRFSDFIDDNRLNWFEAESHCISRYSSHLLSIHSFETFREIVFEIISINKSINNFWIGLSNINGESVSDYIWSDGTPFDFGTDLSGNLQSGPWDKGNPNNIDYDFILLRGLNNLLWCDVSNDAQYFWICNDSPMIIENEELYYNQYTLSIFIIFGGIIFICLCILICSIIILKTIKRKMEKNRNTLNCMKIANDLQIHEKISPEMIASNTYSVDITHSMDSERLSVDQGIIDKIQKRQKSKSKSINLTIDMNSGHINIDYHSHHHHHHIFKTKPYRKRKHKNTIENDGENVELEPDEFIVDGDSNKYDSDDIIDQYKKKGINNNMLDIRKGINGFLNDYDKVICIRKVTGDYLEHGDDDYNDPELPGYDRQITTTDDININDNENAEYLHDQDTDGYYIDPQDNEEMKMGINYHRKETNEYLEDEQHDGIQSPLDDDDDVIEGMENFGDVYCTKNIRKQTKRNDSDEEYYEDPMHGMEINDDEEYKLYRKKTDGFMSNNDKYDPLDLGNDEFMVKGDSEIKFILNQDGKRSST